MRILFYLISAAVLANFAAAQDKPAAKSEQKPLVEAVFVLDSTGSMGELIKGAKEKIWDIALEIVQQTPRPDVKMGIVTYRDKGDEYVTKRFPLTADLDAMYADLKTIAAEGGGDAPESVNEALFEAVNKIQWSPKDKNVYRVIFLVGDCPPHLDYQDDVKYDVSCKKAAEKDIIINTILCGSNQEAGEIWRDIARRTDGKFTQILQSGGVIAVETPYDKDIAELSLRLNKTVIVYGSVKSQLAVSSKIQSAEKMENKVMAQRAALNNSMGGRAVQFAADGVSNDLLSDAKNDKDIIKILENEKLLPDELKKLSLDERKKYADTKKKERDELNKQIAELSRKRTDWLATEGKKKREKLTVSSTIGGAADISGKTVLAAPYSPAAEPVKGFDESVSETIKEQFEKKQKK